MEKTKSFRYSPEEHPKVERWIQTLEKAGVNFSTAIRRLIEDSEIEKDRIQKELDDLKRKLESLTGYQVNPPDQELKANNDQEEPATVDVSFIKNRYFK